jgi:hypothetical protein
MVRGMRLPPGLALGASTLVVVTQLGCGGDGGAQPTMCVGASIVASEQNDYAFSSTITLPPITVAHMADLSFDWGALTKDFQGRPLAPATDLGMALVMIWDLPIAEFEATLNADELYPADLVVSPPLNLPLTGATSGKLYNFLLNGTAVTPEMFKLYFDAGLYTAANSTFLVGVQSGIDLGRNLRMLQAFHVDAASTVTDIALTNASTKLTYSANLHSLTIMGVPAGTPMLTLDWSQMKTNALGHEFKEGYVTSAIVGHYTQTPAELEAKFLDLDRIAMATYRADIPSGSVLDFTTLKDANGAAFPGIDDQGTWLVGLTCGNCRNPAPWYMTILKTCSK